MSDVLTPGAPESDAAASSVEVPAPADEMAALDGSAGNLIPVERFNGLMARMNQERQARVEAEQQLAVALMAQRTEPETTSVADETTAQELRELREELRLERLENARQQVLDEFPGAKPFADLIQGNNKEELRSIARLVEQRMQAVLTPQQEAAAAEGEAAPAAAPAEPAVTTPTPQVVTPTAPVVAGGASVDTQASTTDRIQEAIRTGNFEDYLAAKSDAAGVGNLA